MFLASRRRFDEALAQLRRAQDLDPLSPVVQSGIGRVLHFSGRYDEAEAQYRRILQVNPAFAQSRVDLALTLLVQRRFADLRGELDRAAEQAGEIGVILMLRALCDIDEGHEAGWRAALEQLRTRYRAGTVSADELACVAQAAGAIDEALQYFDEACVSRAPILPYFEVEPMTLDVRKDPRFLDIARRHGLPLMD
jgi:tetratricopeptide (TPR) repeat protein